MGSEVSRTEEQLEDAKRLQTFLEDLTPSEWREGLVKARDDRHEARMAAWRSECDGIRQKQEVGLAGVELQAP